jgi:hypothetical protein
MGAELSGWMEEIQNSLIGHTIIRLMQTPSESMGVIIEAFGEAFWITLVAEMDDGRLAQINEYDCTNFAGDPAKLIPAELVQDQYKLSDLEGHKVEGVVDHEGEFVLVMDNGLCFHCSGAPGGNFPWIYRFGQVSD